jgi:hypothetical protein
MTKSSAPASERLREHLGRLVDEIQATISSGLYSGSPEAVASNREEVLSEILSRFLPRTFDLGKGKIYDANGGLSDSIDTVILAGNHPKFRNARSQIEILLADGVYAAIELKPVLTDLPDLALDRAQPPELWRALSQARSVKQLKRVTSGLLPTFAAQRSTELDDYSRRVPAYIVTGKAPTPSEIGAYIAAYYVKHGIPLEEQFDVLVILNHGLLVNVKYREHFLVRKDASVFRPAILTYTTRNSLVEFLLLLMLEVPPEATMSAPFLPQYFQALLDNERTGQYPWTAG